MIKLTVFFENPFWIGVFEKVENDNIRTCKVTFGSEPKDYEIYEFLLVNYSKLKFSRPMGIEHKKSKKINPKRMQRLVKKALQDTGIGTKAQQAMKLEHEANKVSRKKKSKEEKELQKKIAYDKRQQKKKKKKRGH